jgi:hypothetical protein
MTFTAIPAGTEPWDAVLNNGILDVQAQAVAAQSTASSALTAANAAVPKDAQLIFAKDHGAAGDGVTDDTSALNTALAAMTGGVFYTGNYKYLISGPITVPSNVTWMGAQGLRVQNVGDVAPVSGLFLSAAFSGAAAIIFPANSSGQRIRQLNIDGHLASGAVDGIQANTGYIHDILLDQVHLYKLPHNGITMAASGGNQAYSWTCTSVTADNCGNNGFSIANATDCTWYSCQSIGCGSAGWSIVNCPNSHFTDCRAEFSGASGFSINGAWTSTNGSGGAIFSSCSTDRNVNNGISVTATGVVPIIIDGAMLRRDGSNGTGAGLSVTNATVPVHVESVSVFPGTNDDGSGTASPVTGVTVSSSTYLNVSSGWIHAITTPINNGAGNTVVRIGPNVGLATGTAGSPTFNYNNPWGTDNGSTFTANLNANDQTGIKVIQAATFTNANNALIDLTTGAAASDNLIKGKISGDTNSRFAIQASGQMNFGPGNALSDTNLYRSSAGVVKTDQTLSATTGLRLNTTSTAGSVGAIAMANATTPPSSNPTSGIIFYSTSGQPTFKDSAGNIVQFTKPTVTGAKGSNAALGSLMTALAAIGLVVDSTTA